MSSQTLTLVRTILYAMAGVICLGYAAAAIFQVQNLPHWLPVATALAVAALFFAAAWIAGDRNIATSLDESYQLDRYIAATAGFWTAIGTGTMLWVFSLGAPLQLAITLTLSSAAFFLTHVVREIRGHL
jgi:hypothetical protein